MTVRLGPATDEATEAVRQPSRAVVKLVGSCRDAAPSVAPPSEVTAPVRGSTHAGPTACSPAGQGGRGTAGGEREYREPEVGGFAAAVHPATTSSSSQSGLATISL